MKHSDQITAAVCYIRRHLKDEGLSGDEVAAHCGLSVDHFNRLFLEHTGFTVMSYIRFLRLHWLARVLLRNRARMSVMEVALECGYHSAESFSRAFKREFGVCPSAYRKKLARIPFPHADFGLDRTLGKRLSKAYPGFSCIPVCAAVDVLLKKDPIAYGYDAIRHESLCGTVMAKGGLESGFLWCTENDDGKLEWATVFANDYDTLADYIKTFRKRADTFSFFSPDDREHVKKELEARGIVAESLERMPRRVCKNAPECSLPEKTTLRRLYPQVDQEVYEAYLQAVGAKEDAKARFLWELEQEHALRYGIFKEDKLIGLVFGYLRVRGALKINTELGVCLLYGLEDEALTSAALCLAAKDLIKQGIVPYACGYLEDGILPEGAFLLDEDLSVLLPDEQRENERASALGYETVNMKYTIALP